MKRQAGIAAVVFALLAWAMGTYSALRPVGEVFEIVTGLCGLLAIGAAVVWWGERGKGRT